MVNLTTNNNKRISPTTVMYIAFELLSKYNTNPKIKKLVDSITWYIIPV
jgi:murein tripeptide amidase MpaA